MDIGEIYTYGGKRIDILNQLGLLNGQPDKELDELVDLAGILTRSEVSVISFIDSHQEIFKSKRGTDQEKMPFIQDFFTGFPEENKLYITQIPPEYRALPNPSIDFSEGYLVSIPIFPEVGLLLGHMFILNSKKDSISDDSLHGFQKLGNQLNVILRNRLELFGLKSKLEEFSQREKEVKFFETILNKLPLDIAIFDANHKYIFVNPGAIKNDEFRKYIIGKDDFEYAAYRGRDISVAEYRRQQFLEIKKTHSEIRWEDNIKGPDGKVNTHLRRLVPVFDDSGQLNMVIGFGIEITDRKLLEEKQLAYVDQLATQNTQLVDFCNIVSHNLRAPLVNMSMLVDFIEESDDDEEKKLLISKLRPVIENLNSTFNELVESIQIKYDHEVKSEELFFEDFLKRELEGLEPEINKSQAIIETDFLEAPFIFYPPKYLSSIIHNLVSNALKYKSPNRKPVIKIKTERQNGKVLFTVSDNGLGIDLEKHRDNFFKIGKVFHRNPNAKGFGLFMTKTQVEAMGGKIWVESTPEEGSIFSIEFINQSL